MFFFPVSARSNGVASRPLVALLDGRDCSVEMPLLKEVLYPIFAPKFEFRIVAGSHGRVLRRAVYGGDS